MYVRAGAYAPTHIWTVFGCPPQCQGYICGRVVQVGSSEILEGAAGGEREREREGGWAADAWEGGCRAAEQSCAEEECRLFPCVGRTGEPSWLQAGAVSP